jgi:hypothetical protein
MVSGKLKQNPIPTHMKHLSRSCTHLMTMACRNRLESVECTRIYRGEIAADCLWNQEHTAIRLQSVQSISGSRVCFCVPLKRFRQTRSTWPSFCRNGPLLSVLSDD